MRVTFLLLLELPSTKAHVLQTLRTAVALSGRGVEVHLHPRVESGEDPREIIGRSFGVDLPAGLRIHALPGPRADLSRGVLAARLLPTLHRGDPHHVLFARERRTLLPVLPLRRLTGRRAPLVYEFHNLEHVVAEEEGELRRAARIRRQEVAIVREADGLVAIGPGLAREVEARFEPPHPVEVLPSGVDLRAFRGTGAADPGGERVHLMYAGSLYPEKGVDTLLAALPLLPERVHLTLVGGNTPDDLARLRSLADGMGMPRERVRFVGQVPAPDVPGHLAGADVLVIPAGRSSHSLRFTSPLKLFEAMATGIPVVVGRSSAFLSIVEPGRTAEVAADPGPHALADAVLRVMEDPARARAMGRRAMERAEAYSWERRAERMEEALRRILKRKRHR